MTTSAPVALAAADLEGNDDEIARHERLHGASDVNNPPGRLVSQRKWAGETRLPPGNHEIQITSRHGKRLDDRVASILNDRRRDIPPFDPVFLDVSQLSHAAFPTKAITFDLRR